MEHVGDFSENPFENAVTDIPMSAMCRSIAIDLQELMDQQKVQERLTPINGILMQGPSRVITFPQKGLTLISIY